MAWRQKGGSKRAEQAFAAATIAHAEGAEDGADAVRGALARTELERALRKVAIVDVGSARVAGAIARALSDDWAMTAGPAAIVKLAGVDAVVAIVPEELSAVEAVKELERFDDQLIGVLVIGRTGAAKQVERMAPSGDDPLAALSALERAADTTDLPPPLPSPPAAESRPTRIDPDAQLQRALVAAQARVRALESDLETVQRDLTVAEERASTAEQRVSELQLQVDSASRTADRHEVAPAAAPEPAQARGLFGRKRRAEALAPPPAPMEQPALLPPHEPDLEPEAESAPEPAAPAPPALVPVSLHPTLHDLERLVDDARRSGRPEGEEWAFYIPLLREHAGTDGTLPTEFDDLVRDVFGSALR